MSVSKGQAAVLVADPGREAAVELARPVPAVAWTLMGTAGWAFLVVGGLDVGLVWYPAAFGNPGWEFGSITTALNGLPLPVMGLTMILASAVARAHRRTATIAIAVASVFLACSLVMGVLYALDLPVALNAVTDPLGVAGLRKAILRSVAQLVVYPLVLVLIIWRATRLVRQREPR